MEANLILHVKVGLGLQGCYCYQVIYMQFGWLEGFIFLFLPE